MIQSSFEGRAFTGRPKPSIIRVKAIFLVAAAIELLMVLYCPKVVVMNVFGITRTENLGYDFLFSQPAGLHLNGLSGISVHVDIMRLMFQMLIVGAIAHYLIRNAK